MPWGRIDDDAWSHDRFDGVGGLSYALYWAAISFSNKKLLDGHLQKHHIEQVCGYRRLPMTAADELIAAGLWIVESGGIWIHDYFDYNDAREEILAKREKNAETQRAWIAAQKAKQVPADETDTPEDLTERLTKRSSNGITNHISNDPYPYPGTPVPGDPEPNSDVANATAPNGAAEQTTVGSVFERFAQRLRDPKANRAATLEIALAEIYGWRGKQQISWMGRLIKEAGGAGQLLEWMTETVHDWPGIDDPHNWLAAVVRQRRNQKNGRPPLSNPYLTAEQLAEKARLDQEQLAEFVAQDQAKWKH